MLLVISQALLKSFLRERLGRLAEFSWLLCLPNRMLYDHFSLALVLLLKFDYLQTQIFYVVLTKLLGDLLFFELEGQLFYFRVLLLGLPDELFIITTQLGVAQCLSDVFLVLRF